MFRIVKKAYSNRGFSLVEVLIAISIGLFLFGVILQVYLNAKNIYRSQDNISTASATLRLANFILWQNIMQAGFAGCRDISSLNLNNKADIGFKPIYGYQDSNLQSDVIVIAKASSEVAKLIDDVKSDTRSFKVDKNLATKTSSILLIADCKNGDLIRVDSGPSKTINSESSLKYSYQAKKTEVRRFERVSFFIGERKEGRGVVRGLYISINGGDRQEIVSGINKMIVSYLVSDNYLTASEIKSWDEVKGVVIELEMSSSFSLERNYRFYVRLRRW